MHLLLLSWLLLSGLSVESGRVFAARNWVEIPFAIGGWKSEITLFPPVLICELILFGLGFEWAVIPSYLSSFIVCWEGGLSPGWAALVACGDPLSMTVIALAYRAVSVSFDLRSWLSRCWFLTASVAASLAGSTGSFVWSAAKHLSTTEALRSWEGWVIGSVFGTVPILAPVLWAGAREWSAFRRKILPDPPRRAASFSFVTGGITAAGILVAAFLAGANHFGEIGLSRTLEIGVPPIIRERIWDVVTTWRIAAWSATLMVGCQTVAAIVFARWWRRISNAKNAALASALTESEEAARIKGQFLATMSHELRTPMNGVLGMNELLLATKLTEEQMEYAQLIETAARSLLNILNDVLDFSKIEAGKLELNPAPFVLRTEVDFVVRLLQSKALSTGLSLTWSWDERLPKTMIGDPDRVRQVLINLAGNAVKFTQHGSVKIRVECLRPAPDLYIRFAVEDTGPGIDKPTLARLFRPFTQADSSMSRKYGGTGLGLSISKRLVETMGGELSVTSTPGKGSEFAFMLPFHETSGEEQGPNPAANRHAHVTHPVIGALQAEPRP